MNNLAIASPDWLCVKCGQKVEGGLLHLCPKTTSIGVFRVQKIAVFRADYERASWKWVLVSMLGFAIQPIVLPIMILLSKLLKRPIEFWPITES